MPNLISKESLCEAVEKGEVDVVKQYIQENQQDNDALNIYNQYQQPLLISAMLCDQVEIFDLLLQTKKINLELVDAYGNTTLNRSALYGKINFLGKMIASGAKVDAPNIQDNTALILATIKEHEDCVKLLIEGGANINKVGSFGNTAYKWAKSLGHKSIQSVLENMGASTVTPKNISFVNDYETIVKGIVPGLTVEKGLFSKSSTNMAEHKDAAPTPTRKGVK